MVLAFVEMCFGAFLGLGFLAIQDPIEPEDLMASALFLTLFAGLPLIVGLTVRRARNRAAVAVLFALALLWPLAIRYA
jgi:hypothetical protein